MQRMVNVMREIAIRQRFITLLTTIKKRRSARRFWSYS